MDAAPPADDRRALPPAGHRRDLLRRLLVVGAVLVGLGLFVAAGMLADTDGSRQASISGDIAEHLIPAADAEVLRQTPVGVDLAPGWALATLTLNDVPVPESEWDVTAELGLFQYSPGAGKTVDQLQGDQNCATAEVFRMADPTDTRTFTWCFTVA